jgi:hypothetical protein
MRSTRCGKAVMVRNCSADWGTETTLRFNSTHTSNDGLNLMSKGGIPLRDSYETWQ